jgi:hypothetical protein
LDGECGPRCAFGIVLLRQPPRFSVTEEDWGGGFVPERLPDGSNVMDQEMSEVPSFSIRAGYSEMIAKLIGAGYLRPDQRHDPNAITKAIERMKLDLRNGNGSVR